MAQKLEILETYFFSTAAYLTCGRGVALTAYCRLAPRLKKELSYTDTTPLSSYGLLRRELYYYYYYYYCYYHHHHHHHYYCGNQLDSSQKTQHFVLTLSPLHKKICVEKSLQLDSIQKSTQLGPLIKSMHLVSLHKSILLGPLHNSMQFEPLQKSKNVNRWITVNATTNLII